MGEIPEYQRPGAVARFAVERAMAELVEGAEGPGGFVEVEAYRGAGYTRRVPRYDARPANNESGHADGCARHRAEVDAYLATWERNPGQRTSPPRRARDLRCYVVGDTGIEPVASSVSRISRRQLPLGISHRLELSCRSEA